MRTIDYDSIPVLQERARRERARAIHDLLIAPLLGFVRDTLHAARPHRPLAG